MANFRFLRQKRVTPVELGYNDALSSGAVTGTAFDITGANAVTFFIHFTRAAGTGNMAFTVDVYDDIKAAWVPVHTVDLSAGSGTLTYFAASFVKATGSASTTMEIRLRDLNHNKMRINSSIITSSSTDSLNISALVSEGPG